VEGHAPETEIAMRHKGSTFIAMRGKIGTLAALTDDAPRRMARPRPKRARKAAISTRRASPYLKPTKAVPGPVARHADAFCFIAH
jgi:hypothetical protein